MNGTRDEVLNDIAKLFVIDAELLIEYANEDTLGGFSPTPDHSRYPGVSNNGIWEVEGQIIYALVRILKPRTILEVGNRWNNSTSHIAAALEENGTGHLYTIDILRTVAELPKRPQVTPIISDLFYFDYSKIAPIDFLFEDSMHTVDMVGYVWRKFAEYGNKGAVIVSHDAEHPAMHDSVSEGISQTTSDYRTYLAEPSDCGIAVWRKP